MLTYESKLRDDGYSLIAGIDEAGRGPLAGPVVAAAVILPPEFNIEGINDSKLLTEKKRDALFNHISQNTLAGVGIVSCKRIDEINIFQATRQAMKEAVESLPETPDYLLVDGKNMRVELNIEQNSIVKGDQLSASIAAASIIAKVTRDRIMEAHDLDYPEYGFKQHKGYPTKKHKEAIEKNGPTIIHRMTFSPLNKQLKEVKYANS